MTDSIEGKDRRASSVDRRWIAASLLLHAGLIAALLGWWRPRAPPEVSAPLVTVIFDRPGAAGAAGGGGKSASPESTPSQEEATAEPSAPEEAEQALAQAETLPPPLPENLPEIASVPLPETPGPAPAAIERGPAPPPAPHPPRKPAQPLTRAPPEARAAATVLPPPSPAPTATPQPAPATVPTETALAAPPGSGSGPGGTRGQGQGNEGAGRGIVGNGPLDGPGDDYLEALRRHLARYKEYPDDAIRKRQEGEVVIGFLLNRDGTVLDAWIVRGSGIPALDAATLAMLRHASPVPRIPDRYKGAELKLTMPIDYSLGFFEKLFR